MTLQNNTHTLEPARDISMDLPIYQAQEASNEDHGNKIIKSWVFEIASLGLAVGLLVAIVTILGHFDGLELPNWPLRISLNTLVALLSTVMRALFLVAVTAVISQSKWLWFNQDRPLSHMDDLDQASRGLWGSLKLLIRGPRSIVGSAGALAVILSLSIGPFTQQAINTVPCVQTLQGLNSSIPIAHFTPGMSVMDTELFDTSGIETPPTSMMAAAMNGILNMNGSDAVITAATTCATGNCTFHHDSEGVTHSSMAICSTCIDTTPIIVLSSTGNFTLPNNQWVSHNGNRALDVHVSSDLSWASSAFTDGFAALTSQSFVNITMLALTSAWCTDNTDLSGCPANVMSHYPGWQSFTGIAATACTLYPCLKNFRANISLGSLNETLVSTMPATNDRKGSLYSDSSYYSNDTRLNYTAVRVPCTIDDIEYNVSTFENVPRIPDRQFLKVTAADDTVYDAPAECVYRMDTWYAFKMFYFMAMVLFPGGGHCETGPYEINWWNTSVLCSDSTPNSNNWWLSSLWNSGSATPQGLVSSMESLSTSITNYLRTTGGTIVSYDDIIPRDWANGTVQKTTVCNTFEWEWLLMPLILLIAGVGLMLATIINNYQHRSQQVWKNSILPLLFYHLTDSTQPSPEALRARNLKEMEKLAQRIVARLQNGTTAGFVVATPAEMSSMTERSNLDTDSLLENER